jgi:hypothetical protein
MLKFSGFSDLTSCSARERPLREGNAAAEGSAGDRGSAQRVLNLFPEQDSTDDLNASTADREECVLMHKDAPESTWRVVHSEGGMLPGISRKRSMRSKSYWFAEFCNLQCLSHFAAPFIVVRAEASIAESCEIHSSHPQGSGKKRVFERL